MAAHDGRRRLAAQDGFTLIELLAALLLLTVGIFAVATTFDFSRASTNQSELKTAAVDRAQREIEAVRSLPYEQVAHPTGGILAAAADQLDPTSRIAAGRFAWNRSNAAQTEALVTAASGAVPMKQTIGKGEGDRFGYTIWRFVTATQEPACATAVACEDDGDEYRRVTIVVRARGLGDRLAPVWTSTTVIDPSLAANNEGQPSTLCQNEAGTALELCSKEVGDDPLEYYLTNTRANSASTRQPIPVDAAQRNLHKTVRVPATCTAGSATGCPIPDLMVTQPLASLEAEDPVPDPVSFATDVVPAFGAGRPLNRDTVACNGTPSRSDDLKGAYWVSPALAAAAQLTGRGGLALYGRTWSGTAKDVTVCGIVYDQPSTIVNPLANPPVEIGRFAASYSWPGAIQRVSLDLYLGLSASKTVAAGRRVGLRLWLPPTSGDDVVLLYDHVDHQSALTLLTKEPE